MIREEAGNTTDLVSPRSPPPKPLAPSRYSSIFQGGQQDHENGAASIIAVSIGAAKITGRGASPGQGIGHKDILELRSARGERHIPRNRPMRIRLPRWSRAAA